ncbi:ATP-binding protein [Bradyrhizobium sp. 146]|uniref:hypothetical protein n=1 Tax=unclassified Bradyrhizobium TaxID=2631580 RepID=UPI00035F7F3C|nr:MULTISPECIES: hypothetical protein [unclassified Bradyrhizobium]MCK1700644.1 ATP-binding protein [Bradyrhizobium sp. 146]
MSLPDIATILLQTLKSFPADMPLDEVLAKIRPQRPPGVAEAIKQCALVRWFDEPLYASLCKDLKDRPPLEEFIQNTEVRRLRPGHWSIEDGERTRVLKDWQAEPHGWKRRNTDIGYHFVARDEPEAQLAAVYHLAASTDPERVIPFFQKWFNRANEADDLAQCNALLEMLRLQEGWRGSQVSAVWREMQLVHAARVLFLDDYYKTGSYFERPELLANFLSVMNRTRGDKVWIFHLHATGGAGKTIFQRWLTARHLVPKRILCARLDFDEWRLNDLRKFPLQLFRRMIERFTQQPSGGDTLRSLLEKLRVEELKSGWNPDLIDEIRRQIRGARITSPIVVMLDTLEEATLSAADWLERCVDALRLIHEICPTLTLVLSGRYNIAARSNVLRAGEFHSYDLPRFTDTEAHQYLEKRGIGSGSVRDAIVERTEAEENTAAKPSEDRLIGRNPFKLAMFAELALNRTNLTADEVRRFPRVDIAYLIERVIKRIESQSVRWMIRYGVIARHLTLEFAEAVLLPPLLKALRGEQKDEPGKGLDDHSRDVWKPDADAVEALEKDGMEGLWNQLSAYERDRGWLTSVKDHGQTELHFHPEVVIPTRELLRGQDIFAELQLAAAAYFERKAESESAAEVALGYLQEAIFHRFQANDTEAKQFWIGQVHGAANRFGPAAAVPVAAEILGRDYAEAERNPRPGVSSPELLVSAHCEAAELLMQAAGLKFVEPVNRNEFNRHIEIALDIAAGKPGLEDAIPLPLKQIFWAWQSGSPEKAAAYLRAAIPGAEGARHAFTLQFQLSNILLKFPAANTPVHLREALRLLPDAEWAGVTTTDLHLALAFHYTFLGAHAAVIEALSSAARSAQNPRARARVINHEAWYAIGVGDGSTAAKRLIQMRTMPADTLPAATSLQLLEGRLAIMDSEPFRALRACEQGLTVADNESERARCLDQRAEARALLFQFRAASNDWDSAAKMYALGVISAGPARCAVLSATMKARAMQDYKEAETEISSALSLPGSEDLEIRTELNLLMAFVLCRTGRTELARSIVAMLIERPAVPPHMHARVLMFALVFKLREASAEFLEDVRETIGQIQPISRTAEALDWVRYAEGGIDVPADFVMRLIGQFARPGSDLSSGIELLIRRADVYRVFGRIDDAGRELDRASAGWLKEAATEFKDAGEGRLLRAWHLNQARKRLGQTTTRFRYLLDRVRTTDLAGTPFHDALVCEAAEEALGAGDAAAAREMLGAHSPADELPNIWQARRLDLLARVAPPEDRSRLHREAADLYQALGLSPPAQPERSSASVPASSLDHAPAQNAIPISQSDLSPSLNNAATSHAFAIDFLSGSWRAFEAELRGVLRNRHAEDAAILPSRAVAALPWELGGALCRQSSVAPPRASIAGDRMRDAAVLLLMPASSEDDVSISASSGFRLQDVYYSRGIKPFIMHVSDVKVLFDAINQNDPPALIHIVAAVREGSGGPYLDFASTTHRLESIGGGSSYGEASLTTAQFLGRLLRGLSRPPFVILDITHPLNAAEAVRMLLLRNMFATELFELGMARGVLGCGLATPDKRHALSAIITDALLSDSVTAPIHRLRDVPPIDLDQLLPRHAAALWTNDPEDRLFLP